jgi:hypothetical protein
MTPNDIRAAIDVLVELQNDSDSLDIESAVAHREAVNELMTAVRTTLALIDTQLVSILESPREINGNRYEVRKSDGKWRPDHSKVQGAVKKAAIVDDNGEVRDTYDAVDRAMIAMEDLYVSASTMPKVGALDRLGLKKWQVASQEPGQRVLKVTPIVQEPS